MGPRERVWGRASERGGGVCHGRAPRAFLARAMLRPLALASVLGLILLSAVLPLADAAAQSSGAADPLAAATPEARARYDAAFAAMIGDPANLDKTFAYAKTAIEVADYEGAIAALERMLFIDPDLPRVRLELGALYFRLGSYEAARTYLTTALAAPAVPPEVRARVEGFLAEIEERLSRHRFSGGIYAGLRAQSNATSAPGGTGVRALGFDATLNQDFTSKSDENLFVIGNVTHSYRLDSLAGASIESTALGYYARQRMERRVDLNVVELTSGPRLPVRLPGLVDSGSVRGYAIGTYVELGGAKYYSGFGGGMELKAAPAQDSEVRVTVEGRAKEYHSSSTRPTNDEQTGFTTGAALRLRQGVTGSLSVNGFLSAQQNSTHFDYNDYTEYALGLGLDYAYRPGIAGGLLPADLPWVTSLSASRVLTGYGGPDPSVDPAVTRQDHDWRMNALTAIPVTRDWTAIFALGRTQRTSSLPNYKYSNTSVSLGASWRF